MEADGDLTFIPRVVDIAVPFAHDPTSKYVAGTAFLDKSKYWRLKYKGKVQPEKWNYPRQVAEHLIELVEKDRLEMLNQEFEASGISSDPSINPSTN